MWEFEMLLNAVRDAMHAFGAKGLLQEVVRRRQGGEDALACRLRHSRP